MRHVGWVVVLLAAFGCSSPAANDPALCDPALSGRDGERVLSAEPSPDGAGWCCRAEGPPLGGACAHTGGWVADPCECGSPSGLSGSGAVTSWCDTPSCAWTALVDEHGCERFVVDLAFTCASR